MGIWNEIASQVGRDDLLKNLSIDQCEAVIDALNLVAYADGQESLLERAELDLLLHQLPWASQTDTPLDIYRSQSASRTQSLLQQGPDGLAEAAELVGQRLQGFKLRKKVLKMAAAVAFADFDAGSTEHNALNALANALGIPPTFAQELVEEIGSDAVGDSFLDVPTEPEIVPAVTNQTVRNVLSNDFLQSFFRTLFTDDDLHHLNEDASLAIVDALTLALVADGYPEAEELQEFKTQLEQLPFAPEDAQHVQARVEVSLNTLRTLPDASLDDYIAQVSARLPSDTIRARALSMAIHITHADLNLSDREHATLHRIAKGFNIPPARVRALITQAKATQGDDYFAD